MTTTIPVQFLNTLHSKKLVLSADDTWLSSNLLTEVYEISTSNNPTECLERLFRVLRTHSFFQRFQRTGMAGRVGNSNQFRALSSSQVNSTRNLMGNGYTCFVAHDSSLFKLKGGTARLIGDIAKALATYKTRELSPQRSLHYLDEMGYASSVALPVIIHDELRGVLFLNSSQPLSKDDFKGSVIYILSILQLWAAQFLMVFYPKQRSFWAAPDLPSFSREFSNDEFETYFQQTSKAVLGKPVELSLASHIDEKFLYIPSYVVGALVHMLRVAAFSQPIDLIELALERKGDKISFMYDQVTRTRIQDALKESLPKTLFCELCENLLEYGLETCNQVADSDVAELAFPFELSSMRALQQYSVT